MNLFEKNFIKLSGLDSSTARNVMKYLHKLSRAGRKLRIIFYFYEQNVEIQSGTIIFSIHQPRYSIFKLFDTVFLLSCGHCIYHGPANGVLSHFLSIGYVCEEHDNPADFLLDITQGDHLAENEDEQVAIEKHEQSARHLNDLYSKSSTHAAMKIELDQRSLVAANPLSEQTEIIGKSFLNEIFYVSQRTLRNAYRNPTLVTMQTIVTIIFAVLVGLIYLKIDNSQSTGVKNRMGAIFFIVTNQVMSNLSAIELFLKERVLFIHENASGYYHVSTYFIAKLICDLIPLRVVPSILFSIIVYFMIGFQNSAVKFLIFFLAIFTTTMCGSALCFLLSASVEVFGIANLIAAMCFVLMMVFGGFLVEISSVVQFLSWIKWVSIFRYSTNIFTINEFDGLNLCLDPSNSSSCIIPGKTIIEDGAHIEYENQWDLWKNFVALGSMTIIFLFFAYVQLYRMKKTK